MILLRELLKFHVNQQVLLNPLDARTAVFRGMANAIFIYLNLQKVSLNLPIYPSSGVITTFPPTPGFSLTSYDTVIKPASTLERLLISNTAGATPFLSPIGHIGIFTAISTWLSTQNIVLNPVGTPLTGGVGTGVITFPLMSSLGLPFYSSILALGINGLLDADKGQDVLEKSYEILSNFIYIGLASNFIPPIPTVGTIGSAYTGVSFPFWLFVDVIDWPIGTSDASEVLSNFGLTSITQLSALSYDEEDDDSELDDCSLQYTNGQFICPTNCNTYDNSNVTCAVDIITSASSSGNFGTADFSEAEKYNATDDLCEQSNDNLNNVVSNGNSEALIRMSTYTGTTEIREYDTTVSAGTIPVSINDINININRVIVKTVFVEDEERSLFKTGFN